jgi:hypothetical protein
MDKQTGGESRNGHFQDAAMRARSVFGLEGDLTNIVSDAQRSEMTARTRQAQVDKLKSNYRTG